MWLVPVRMRSCGKPLSNAEIKVVDGDNVELPPAQVGEIVVRSPLIKGYWNLPEVTASTIRDGWLHTGGAGYFDADGYLYVHDRVTEMIISGGENIYPAEVESALFGHPAVAHPTRHPSRSTSPSPCHATLPECF